MPSNESEEFEFRLRAEQEAQASDVSIKDAAPITPPTPKAKPSLLERFKAKMSSPEAEAHPLRTAGEAIVETVPTALSPIMQRGAAVAPASSISDTIPGVLPTKAYSEPSLYDKAVGGAEATLGTIGGLATGLVAAPYGVARDIYERTFGDGKAGVSEADKYAAQVMENAPLQPKTELGKEYGTKVGEAMASIPAFIPHVPGVGNAVPSAKIAGRMAINPVIESAQRHQEAATKLESKNFIKDETNKTARAADYKIFGEGLASRMASGLSGGAKLKQEYQINNQEVTTGLGKKALGVPDEVPLSTDVTKEVRGEAYKEGFIPLKNLGEIQTDAAYKSSLDGLTESATEAAKSFPDYKEVAGNTAAIESLVNAFKRPSFDAAHAITAISDLRESASGAYRNGNYDIAHANRAIASALEDQIERHLEASGADGAAQLQKLRDARKRIAQAHTVEDALVGSEIDAQKVKAEYRRNKGKFAEGPLLTIAKTAEQHSDIMKIPTSQNKLPVSAIDAGLEAGGVAGSLAGHGLMGGAAMALPFAKIAVRKILSSKMAQSRMGKTYDTPIADFIAVKARETASERFDRIKAERMRQHEAESATEEQKQSSSDTYKTDREKAQAEQQAKQSFDDTYNADSERAREKRETKNAKKEWDDIYKKQTAGKKQSYTNSGEKAQADKQNTQESAKPKDRGYSSTTTQQPDGTYTVNEDKHVLGDSVDGKPQEPVFYATREEVNKARREHNRASPDQMFESEMHPTKTTQTKTGRGGVAQHEGYTLKEINRREPSAKTEGAKEAPKQEAPKKPEEKAASNSNTTSGSSYLGGSTVTDATGLHLENNSTLEIHLPLGESLYGIASSGTTNVRVLTPDAD